MNKYLFPPLMVIIIALFQGAIIMDTAAQAGGKLALSGVLWIIVLIVTACIYSETHND